MNGVALDVPPRFFSLAPPGGPSPRDRFHDLGRTGLCQL